MDGHLSPGLYLFNRDLDNSRRLEESVLYLDSVLVLPLNVRLFLCNTSNRKQNCMMFIIFIMNANIKNHQSLLLQMMTATALYSVPTIFWFFLKIIYYFILFLLFF